VTQKERPADPAGATAAAPAPAPAPAPVAVPVAVPDPVPVPVPFPIHPVPFPLPLPSPFPFPSPTSCRRSRPHPGRRQGARPPQGAGRSEAPAAKKPPAKEQAWDPTHCRAQVALASLALASLALSSFAYADPKKDAQPHLAASAKLFGDGKYAEALDELLAAYSLDPQPGCSIRSAR